MLRNKLKYILSIVICLSSCGEQMIYTCIKNRSRCGEVSPTRDGNDGRNGTSGPAGSEGPHGADGKQGVPGPRGDTAPAGTPGREGQVGAPGPKGQEGEQGIPGTPGPQGAQGETGPSGTPGASCTVTRVLSTDNGSGGALISCEDGTSVLVYDGIDGQNGQPAPATPFTITEIIDPCGKQSQFDEVLLRLADGSILAHYASGNQQFLTEVGPGSYITTDGNSCHFTVHTDGSITW